MKTIFSICVLLTSAVALACPDISGKYTYVGAQETVIFYQDACNSITMVEGLVDRDYQPTTLTVIMDGIERRFDMDEEVPTFITGAFEEYTVVINTRILDGDAGVPSKTTFTKLENGDLRVDDVVGNGHAEVYVLKKLN